MGQRFRVTDTRHHVLALSVHQEIAINTRFTGGRIPGEGHTGTRIVTHISENHGADVHRSPQRVRNPFAATVNRSPLRIPRTEDCLHCHIHLGTRILREITAGLFFNNLLELCRQILQVFGRQIHVSAGANFFFHGIQGISKQVAIDTQNGLTKHLHQAAIRVPSKTLRSRHFRQSGYRTVIQPHVEDGFHHARHRELRTRTY